MSIQKCFSGFVLLLFSAVAVAQPKVEVGGWQVYSCYFNGQDLVEMSGNLYYATKNAVVAVDLKDDYAYEILSKKEGLSDIGIRCLGVSNALKMLVICYDNSNIDLYNGKNIFNVPDLFNKQMSGNKSINKVFCHGNYAYLACGFGIMVVDLKKKVVKDTWFFQGGSQTLEVNDVVIVDNTVYAATDWGIFQSKLSNSAINNFAAWEKVVTVDSYNNSLFRQFAVLGNTVYVLKTDTLEIQTDTTSTYITKAAIYVKNNDSWEAATIDIEDSSPHFYCRFIRASQDKLFLGTNGEIQRFQWNPTDNTLKREKIYYWLRSPAAAMQASDGRTYISSGYGLSWGGAEDWVHGIPIPGPAQDPATAMDWKKSKLVVVHNALNDWVPAWERANLSTLRGENWTITTENSQLYPVDFIDVSIAPYDTSVVFAASYLQGIVEMRSDTIYTAYNHTNTPSLRSIDGFTTRTSNVVFDGYNNLWTSNWGNPNPLVVKMQNGEWKSFNAPYVGFGEIGTILADSRDWLWMTYDRGRKLAIFHPNRSDGTIRSDFSRWKDLNLSLKEEEGAFTYIYSIAETIDTQIWIGTDRGVKIYYNPIRLWNEPQITPSPIVVEAIRGEDTLNELVLGFESVRCIKVDGGNRKWVGTENAGVFLLSADGRTELLHFTKDNSPLPSNAVYSIEIDGETGEVFLGTDRGLASFRYTATDGKENYDNLKIFPNPVRENFDGYISITGLKRDSEVKIADAQGGLVHRTVSNGGTAVWDGKRFDGQKVSTGVYFVFINDENGKERKAGKILVVR